MKEVKSILQLFFLLLLFLPICLMAQQTEINSPPFDFVKASKDAHILTQNFQEQTPEQKAFESIKHGAIATTVGLALVTAGFALSKSEKIDNLILGQDLRIVGGGIATLGGLTMSINLAKLQGAKQPLKEARKYDPSRDDIIRN